MLSQHLHQAELHLQLTQSRKNAAGNDEQKKTQIDKTEINDAVAKVLQGYDWTLVPIATK